MNKIWLTRFGATLVAAALLSIPATPASAQDTTPGGVRDADLDDDDDDGDSGRWGLLGLLGLVGLAGLRRRDRHDHVVHSHGSATRA